MTFTIGSLVLLFSIIVVGWGFTLFILYKRTGALVWIARNPKASGEYKSDLASEVLE